MRTLVRPSLVSLGSVFRPTTKATKSNKAAAMRVIPLVLWSLFLVAPTLAQTYIHAYGGTSVVPRDDTKANFIGGAGSEAGSAYVGFDLYGLRPTGDTKEGLDDFGLTIQGGGYDGVIGGAVAKTSKYSVIPVGIFGYSRVKACRSSGCDDPVMEEQQANFGAGILFRIMGSGSAGFHTGFRYTRNYGAAFTVGVVFGGND